MGRYITTTGTAGVVTKEISADHDAAVNERILADVSTAPITITLPANSTLLLNDTIEIIDVTGSAGGNAITVGRNGSLIQGSTEDLTIDVAGSIVTLIYTGATYGWIVGSV